MTKVSDLIKKEKPNDGIKSNKVKVSDLIKTSEPMEEGSMGKPEGSQEPLEQSEGTTTTSSSETQSPTSKSPYDIRSKDVVIDESGEPSTVKMATETFDGKNWHSFPTLFPKDPNNQTNNPDDWISYDDPKEAYAEAKKRGEVWDFNEDKEGAIAFGEGSWKKPTQEQSGEGIDLDYFLSQAPKATEVDNKQEQPRETYDPEYIAKEEAKLSEEFNRVKQLKKEVAKNGSPYETQLIELRDSTDEQIKSLSDSVSNEYSNILEQSAMQLQGSFKNTQDSLQEQVNLGNMSVDEANKKLDVEEEFLTKKAKDIAKQYLPELEKKLKERQSEIDANYNETQKSLIEKQNIYEKQQYDKRIKEMGFFENLGHSLQNEWVKTKMMPAQVGQILLQLEPEESDDAWAKYYKEKGIPVKSRQERALDNYKETEELKKELEPTKQIIKSIKDEDYIGAASAAVGSTMNLVGSVVRAFITGGVSMSGEIGEPMWVSAVKAKVEETGKTPEQIIVEDSEDELTAMTLGGLALVSERFGMKGTKNFIKSKVLKKEISNEIKKKSPTLIGTIIKEDATELFQGGIEKVNDKILKEGNSLYSKEGGKALINEMGKFLISEEGAETLVSTTVGSLIMLGGSKGAVAAYNNITTPSVDVSIPTINDIIDDSKGAREGIDKLFKAGKITEEDYANATGLINNIESYNESLSKDNTNRAESIKLFFLRDKKKAELETLDESQREGLQEEIDGINERLKEISTPKEETTEQPTADVPSDGQNNGKKVGENGEVEAKKTDIEKRRQEELRSKGFSSIIGEAVNKVIGKISDGINVLKDVKSTGEVLKKYLPQRVGNYVLSSDGTFSSDGNWRIAYEQESEEKTNVNTGEKFRDINSQYVPLDKDILLSGNEEAIKTHIKERIDKAGINNVKAEEANKINAKYDAELAALEPAQQKDSEEVQQEVAALENVESTANALGFISKGKIKLAKIFSLSNTKIPSRDDELMVDIKERTNKHGLNLSNLLLKSGESIFDMATKISLDSSEITSFFELMRGVIGVNENVDDKTKQFRDGFMDMANMVVNPEDISEFFDEVSISNEVAFLEEKERREAQANSARELIKRDSEDKVIGNDLLELAEEIADGIEAGEVFNVDGFDNIIGGKPKSYQEQISEAYHKAKQDGTNSELVQAVETLLTTKESKPKQETKKDREEEQVEKATSSETAIPEGKKKSEAYTTEEVVEIGDDRIEEFVASQAEAKAQRSDDALQDTPLTVEGVRKIKADGGKLFMTSDGKSGGYVTKDGYMGGLFKQPKSGRRGAAKVLQEARIKAGGKFFEAFGINQETGEGTTLEQIYIENGFRPVARMTFNPEIAPEGWEGTNLKSRPDNVFFVYDPNGQYEAGDGTRIEDYNQAYELAKNQANETKTKPKAGNRLFNEPLKAVKEIADRYYERVFGKPRKEFQGTRELDVERAKRLSDAFEAMKNDPNNPEVRKAYEALAKETIEQYKDFVDAGYVVEINNEEPYANAQEMIDDLRKNKKIKIFSTESGFGDNAITEEQRAENPLLARTEFTDVNGVPMLVNDLFRAIHDFYGHAELGNGFGAIGEENAWNLHARMFSPLARRAMTTETRGQNSWVNFSGANDKIKALRQEARRLREEGAPKEQVQKIVDEIYEIGSFADQKIGLLPEEFSDISESLEKQDASKKKPRVRIRTAKIKLKPEQKINYKVGDDILSGKVVEDLGNEVSVETPSGDTVVIDKKDLSNPPKPKRKRIRTVQDETEGLTQKEQTKQAVGELSDAFIREKKAAVKKIRTSLQEKAKRIFELNKKKKDNRKLLKDFSRDLLDKMNKSGIKSARIKEVKTIINQIGKDVSSDKQLQESVGRIINAIQDLNDLKKIEDYNKKLSDANSKSKSIKRKSKSKTQIATLKNIAKRFSLINPKDVSNIDEYLEFAGELNNALSAPIVKMDGVETKSPINKDKINNYIEEALSENESSSKAKLLDNFSDYADMGAIDGSMTSKEIKEVIDAIEGGKDVPSKNIEAFRQVASRYLSAQQKALKEVIKEAPQNVKSRLRDLSNARLDLLDYKDMVMAIRTINNAIENLDIDNVDLITARATAKENAISFAKGRPKISEISFGKSLMIGDTLKSFSKTLARLYLKGVGSTTLIAEGIFGFEGLVKFIDKSRFFDVLKGYKDSQKYSKKIFDKYNNKFKNVKDFFSKDNVYERGIVAYLGRFKDDSVAEFERRKKLLTETLSDLEKSDFEKYESYLSVYNKVVRDSKNFDEVKSKAEKNNVDAVNFWVDEFSKHFDSMSDVSMAVYNTMLDKENNYLPDTYKRIKGVESKNKDPKQVGSSFLGSFDNIDKSKSGRFNEVVSPKTLAKRRYVDLSFEENMVKSLESILTDINTAKDIQYLSEFIDSDAIRDLFKSTDDYKFLRGRVISLIDNIKQNSIPMDEDSMQASKLVNRIGKTSTGLALVGLGQPIKQFVPVMLNTVINLVGKGFTLPDFKVREGQKKILGESITSFRGLESTANIDNQVNKYLDGRPNLLNKALDKSLKMAIENPDKAAAGISWVSYYTKRLKSQGKEVQFDKLDREASIYADLQVSRQQNVPTKELMGELFTSKQLSTRIVKSIFFPFSGFAFNIKTRIWTDVKALKSKNSTKPEKQMAAKSLVGATTELVAYRILQGAITYMIGYMVNVMLLGEDEEEFKEKQAKTFKRSLLNNGINDVLSPAPPLDKAVAYTFNKKILEPTYEKMNVEEKDRIYAYDKSYGNDLGLLGIPYEKGQKFYKMLDMSVDVGDVPLFDAKQYFTDKDIEKRISENDKAVMQVVAPIYGLYLMGLMPREVGSAAEKAMQTIERRSKANNSGSKSSSSSESEPREKLKAPLRGGGE